MGLPRKLELARCAVVGYKDETGIGRQCHNMRRVLGIGRHLVAPSTRMQGHPIETPDEHVLEYSATDGAIRTLLTGLDCLFVIERNKWHPRLFQIAKDMGVFLCVIPNWEWFDVNDEAYGLVDVFVVHSKYSLRVIHRAGFKNCVLLAPPVDLDLLPLRRVAGKPRLFVHNAGIIDLTDRKGTFSTIRAWGLKPRSRAWLRVRYQSSAMPIPEHSSVPNLIVEEINALGPRQLYADADCAVQPSKLEGLGYMILEPLLSGVPTLLADAPPMNEFTLGTIPCDGTYSGEPSIPTLRGIGDAKLFEVDDRALAAAVERIENIDLGDLSAAALAFRAQFDRGEVKRQWQKLLEGL